MDIEPSRVLMRGSVVSCCVFILPSRVLNLVFMLLSRKLMLFSIFLEEPSRDKSLCDMSGISRFLKVPSRVFILAIRLSGLNRSRLIRLPSMVLILGSMSLLSR